METEFNKIIEHYLTEDGLLDMANQNIPPPYLYIGMSELSYEDERENRYELYVTNNETQWGIMYNSDRTRARSFVVSIHPEEILVFCEAATPEETLAKFNKSEDKNLTDISQLIELCNNSYVSDGDWGFAFFSRNDHTGKMDILGWPDNCKISFI